MTPVSVQPAGGRRWQLQRRSEPGNVQRFRLGAVLIGLVLVIVAGAFAVDGAPNDYFLTLWNGTFGSTIGLDAILLQMLPFLLLGLAVALPYRLGLWNVGGDGQLLMGAWAATGIAFVLSSWPGWALLPAMFVAGAVVGALWILVPALARTRLGVSEIASTLMLNFVAVFWMTYWATKPWGENLSAGGIKSEPIPAQVMVGYVTLGQISVPITLLGAIALALGLWVWSKKSRFAYEVEIVGSNPEAARYAGMPVNRRIVQMMLIGGAIAGLAGAMELVNVTHRYGSSLTNNYGYSAFVIAVLAAGREAGVLLLALLLAAMGVATNALLVFGVSSDLLFATFGLILLLGALGDGLARFQLVRVPARSAGRADAAVTQETS
ncbi:ABC transporter permease [Conexibacter woesei]|uniref:Inner-membrane translocator n=1 Tax=Conexibacter woesei (strain DSM 14684 / CCUG 47730 / CIP 108061 / JCM 11494 / NBRC 100937 / ID131577) TaxID=469383 RepID=D3F892_CONWI|nr:ABC transporter permease [Conexibacter woesei]ADB48962.1 inner-membrane translocator [Conexibacter woesei DSM 14684]